MKKIVFKIIKLMVLLVLLFGFSGLAGIFFVEYVFPQISSWPVISGMKIFQLSRERTKIINKTEQIIVSEDFSPNKIAEKILPSVMTVVPVSLEEKGGTPNDIFNNSQSTTALILTSDGLAVSFVPTEINLDTLALQVGKSGFKFFTVMGEFDGVIKKIDRYSRLIFYQLNASNLPAVSFGEGAEIENGEKIIVCGETSAERKFNFSVGVIKEKNSQFSLLSSKLSVSEVLDNVMTIDARVSEENIGGPVVDTSGNLLGLAGSLKKEGVDRDFFIAGDQLKELMDWAIADNGTDRPFLGVYYLPLSRPLAVIKGLRVSRGALIYSSSGQQGLAVLKGSPAEKAGLKIGDIITKVGDNEITNEKSLSYFIARQKPNESISLTVLRQGTELKLETVLK